MITTAFDRQVIRNLRSFGCSYNEIAEMVGCLREQAYYWSRGIVPPKSVRPRAYHRNGKFPKAAPKIKSVPRLPCAEEGGIAFPSRAQLMAGR